MEKPQIISHIQKSLNYTVFDVRWIPKSAKFVVLGSFARATGALQIYEVVEGDVKLLKECEKSGAIKCGTFGASSLNQRYLATGNFSGHLQLWNLEYSDAPVYSAKAHDQIINTIDGVGGLGIGKGAPEIITGSRDGIVKVWDTRQKDSPVAEMKPVEKHERKDCWTVAFGHAHTDAERCICSGYDNGDIKLFDLRTMSARWETNVQDGVCSVEFDRKDIDMNKIVATTMHEKIHVFDVRTQHPTEGFASLVQTSHKSTVWCARHLPQNRDIFATTGGNGTVTLWKYNYPDKRQEKAADGELEGQIGTLSKLQWSKLSSQPVTGFDWNRDKTGLAVCSSFDQTLQVLVVTKLNRV